MGTFCQRLGAVCVLICMPTVSLGLPSGYNWIEHEGKGKWYALTQNFGPWQACEDEAVGIGAHLANINNQDENDWLAETFKETNTQGPTDNNIAWIGLRGFISDSSLYWVCGDPVDYTTFTPVRLSDGEYWYLHGNNHTEARYWNSNPVHNTDPNEYPKGIIEIPEPATLSLLALGGLMLIRKRRA